MMVASRAWERGNALTELDNAWGGCVTCLRGVGGVMLSVVPFYFLACGGQNGGPIFSKQERVGFASF